MAKISKKMMATVLTASMVAALGSTSAFAEEAASDEDFSGVELNFWTAPYGDDEEAFLKEHLAAWEERTGATVNIEITPWDSYEEKMMTGIAGSDGPDIAYMYNEMIYNYMANGQLEPLDDYFTDEEKDNYIYWSNGTVQGTQYMLPYLVGAPRVLFANMDLLNEAGWDHVPTTWDELKQCAKDVQEKTGKLGFDQYWKGYFGDLDEIYFPYLWQAGGDIVDADGNLTLDSDAALKAAEFVYSLKTEGILPESCVSRDADAVTQDFRNGELAMYVSSSVAAKKNTEAGINWDYVPYLTDEQGGTFVANDSLVMLSSCENKEAAASLMKELTSATMMQDFHENLYSMPPITKEETYADDPKFEEMYSGDASAQFHALPIMNNSSQIMSTLYANLQRMMMDELTPEEALSETMNYANGL